MILNNPTHIIVDTIMGGSSHANASITTYCNFYGTVYVHNGGFSMIIFSVKEYEHDYICLKCKGDRNIYKLVVECNNIMYQCDFQCSPTLTHQHILLVDLIPTFRGIPVEAPPIDNQHISSIGIMISKLDDNGQIIYTNDIHFNINFIIYIKNICIWIYTLRMSDI